MEGHQPLNSPLMIKLPNKLWSGHNHYQRDYANLW